MKELGPDKAEFIDSFKPQMPKEWIKDYNEWLSTFEIEDSLEQHLDADDNFYFYCAVTIDFKKSGSQIQAWNLISAFFNARLQGYAKIFDGFKNRPIQTTAYISAYIVAPSILLWLKNHDDPRYQELKRWESIDKEIETFILENSEVKWNDKKFLNALANDNVEMNIKANRN